MTGGLSVSELQASLSEARDIQQSEQTLQPDAGELLKKAREATGLHIAALAVLLKVPVKKLEALEANRLDLQSDAVFVRALASSVCRSLKIDPAPVLARLPQTDTPKLTYQGLGINAPFRAPGDGPGPTIWAQVSKSTVFAGLLLLLGTLVIVFLPAIKTALNEVKFKLTDSPVSGVGAAARAAEPANNGPEQSTGSFGQGAARQDASRPGVSAVDMPVQSVAGTAALVSSGNLSLILTTSATSTVSGSAQSTEPKILVPGAALITSDGAVRPVLDTDVIVFTAKGQSWVEATDAKGQVVLRRMLKAGDAAGANGVLPIKVVVGRANETEVQIRGKSFDLTAVAKDNVARFEVK